MSNPDENSEEINILSSLFQGSISITVATAVIQILKSKGIEITNSLIENITTKSFLSANKIFPFLYPTLFSLSEKEARRMLPEIIKGFDSEKK